ncbi:MAG: hypothetical protein JXK08_11025 [Flavobacteriaceae bacterium]|nr:hypothetical protein [Flavobacteriaceae bacterium]
MKLKDKIIENIDKSLDSKSLSRLDVFYFLQQIRLLIEIDSLSKKYPLICFYCNWQVHKSISKNPIRNNIINDIIDAFENINSHYDFVKKVNQSLSVKDFITQLKEILYKYSFADKHSSLIENDEFWKNFITIMLNEIVLRPVRLSSKGITIKDFNQSFSISGFQLINHNNKIVIEILSQELKDKKLLFELAPLI